jgi:hypothetical protein
MRAYHLLEWHMEIRGETQYVSLAMPRLVPTRALVYEDSVYLWEGAFFPQRKQQELADWLEEVRLGRWKRLHLKALALGRRFRDAEDVFQGRLS